MEEQQKKGEEGKVEEIKPKAKKPAKKKATKKAKPAKKKTVKKKTAPKKEAPKKELPVKKIEVKSVPTPKKEKPVTFTEKRKEKKKGGGFGFFLFILIVILLIGGAFYRTQQVSEETEDANQDLREDVSSEVSFLKEKLQSLTQQLEDQKKDKEVKKNSYTSVDLGITFTYPAELGDVSEEILTQAGVEEGVNEQSIMITFSGNPDIWLSASTAGYTDETGLIYTGNQENLRTLCVDPLAITETGYCDFMNLLEQETVEQVYVLGGETISNIVKSVPVNLNTGMYKGLTVNVSLGAPPVTGRNLFAPTSDESSKAGVEDFLRNVIKEDGLSLITLENIKAYEEIITTLSRG